MTFDKALSKVINLQLDRLMSNYTDFTSTEEYKNMPAFFRDYLYAPANKAERDEQLVVLKERISTVAREKTTRNVTRLVELAQLTDRLDRETTGYVLELTENGKPFNLETVEEAFIRTGKPELRLKQIDMVYEVMNFFFSLSKMPMIKIALTTVKIASKIIDIANLYDTVEAGYRVARNIDDITPFLEAFKQRETEYIRETIGLPDDFTANSL